MIDLATLTRALGELDEEKVLSMLNEFAAGNPTKAEANKAIEACQKGMAVVGEQFETGAYYVGDLMFAGEVLSEAIKILEPIIGSDSSEKVGKIVLGTVHEDLHDIGKNIFKSMAEASGFEVYDLGIDVPVSSFVEKVLEVKPEIVGLSGVLTLAIDSMKDTIDGLKDAGIRDDVKVTIGGACASYDTMVVTGADAWSNNAAETVNVCLDWVRGA
ncbi:cobalamin B12-binding domain-containing protein [Robinsoniella peoriensis]|uniref:cobalamin B12-binding domain-containing protein n=1 Tax=Robinsoniella peoriensis TaxID=180332 RepID=UPI0005C7D200|nr:cobalamin-dependent protein [Robinsoniella peoriensis]